MNLKVATRQAAFFATAALGMICGSAAMAGDTVECQSRHYQYGECWAGVLVQPQLIHQSSSAACIVNNTWGYNPATQNIWVSNGCAGVFADVGGYHHGRGDTFDAGARRYGNQGHDLGAVVGGVIAQALVESVLDGGHGRHHHSSSNYSDHGGHNHCHGSMCPSDYTGCHGAGCLVDNPDGVLPEPGQTSFE